MLLTMSKQQQQQQQQQPLTELLPINQLNINHSIARKIIGSYAATFNELATVYELIPEFSKDDATLNEAKFIADMGALMRFDTDPLGLSTQGENEESQMIKIELQLKTFITCFNQLDQLQRIIIYYSYFKNESAVKIVQLRLNEKQTYSVRTFYRKNNEASILLVKKLKWHKVKKLMTL